VFEDLKADLVSSNGEAIGDTSILLLTNTTSVERQLTSYWIQICACILFVTGELTAKTKFTLFCIVKRLFGSGFRYVRVYYL
jgi:hypothetical protein